ncbi:MAG: alkane 1-monooxygenase [Parvularcula sp.]
MADGAALTFVDQKKTAWLLGGLFTFSMPLLVIGAYFAAGYSAAMLLILPLYVFLGVPLIDLIIGKDRVNPPPEAVPGLAEDPYYMGVARALVVFGFFSGLACIIFLATTPLPWWVYGTFLPASGIVSGVMINLAHELGHKTDPIDRFFAKLSLGAVGYGHFTADHNLGHHKNVATPEDHASAQLGESVYAFARRELPGALRSGWAIEAALLKRKGQKVWSRHNEILQADAITLGVALALTAVFGWKVLPVLILHHFFSWYALTMVNYVEHYGLLRARTPNGRYEATRARHSWNTNHLFSNIMQIQLQRHSDHHAHPMRPYQALRHLGEAPQLPTGYPGAIALASIPPLWFRIIDPKVLKWAGGDLQQANLFAPAKKRLSARWG